MKTSLTKSLWAIFISILIGQTPALADAPAWMQIENSEIEPPLHLSDTEQAECTKRLLTELTRAIHYSFNVTDVARIQMSNWRQAEMGFMRGGGFNIRVMASLSKTDPARRRLHPGRFASAKTWITLGAVPSLHLPEEIGGVKTFIETENSALGILHYDFIAHLDSGYAYLPLGLGLHLIRDLLGAKSRDPCPSE